jgi:hypothetical protein
MKRLIDCPLLALLALTAGCTRESPVSPTAEQVVVQAYLYADEPVSDIRLTRTLPLGGQETEAPPVNDAEVSLQKHGVEYKLTASQGDSGYYHYSKDDLAVRAGDDFQIIIRYGGLTIEAETSVPPAPDSVNVSSDTLVLSNEYGPPVGGFEGREDSAGTLTVSWKKESSALYYVVVECVEENPDTIQTSGFFPGSGNGGGMRRMISAPFSDNRYPIRRSDLSFLGRHRVKIYRVNQEYADLYGSRQQDSRDLNEPLTNIRNGLGVFSAFNSSAVYFEVIQQ